MYSFNKKKSIAVLLCMNIVGYIISSPVEADPYLGLNRTEVAIEQEVRLLAKDLGKSDKIPEEDIIFLSIGVRKHLNDMAHMAYYFPFNPKEEVRKVMAGFVAKRAYQHAVAFTDDSARIAKVVSIESNEFMGLLEKNPSRNGKKLHPFFGETFENR